MCYLESLFVGDGEAQWGWMEGILELCPVAASCLREGCNEGYVTPSWRA